MKWYVPSQRSCNINNEDRRLVARPAAVTTGAHRQRCLAAHQQAPETVPGDAQRQVRCSPGTAPRLQTAGHPAPTVPVHLTGASSVPVYLTAGAVPAHRYPAHQQPAALSTIVHILHLIQCTILQVAASSTEYHSACPAYDTVHQTSSSSQQH